jgi:Uma2 family endonuclease
MAVSTHTPTNRPATLEDFLAIPATARFHEILDGQLVLKPMPSAKHAHAQRKLGAILDPYSEGTDQKDCWWILSEGEILLAKGQQPLRPDIAAWRRERMSELPTTWPIEVLPDWVCEVVSKDDFRRDIITKRRDYAQAGIPHYWLADLRTDVVTTLRLVDEVYVVEHEAGRGERLRAAPFERVEIRIDTVFGIAGKVIS